MQVTFWGTRGSIAKAGPTTVRTGGNTSCVEVTSDRGTTIVIDCGTGAHGLGLDLLERHDGGPVDGHLLITHTHWDHIQGLPFFAPLFTPGSSWQIYGPMGLGSSLAESLAGQMQYSYFPITLEQLGARIEYHDLVEGTFEIDDVSVTTHYLNHPALTIGYRLSVDGATVVYASDHEPHLPPLGGGGDLRANGQDAGHVEFLRDADLVIHDAQYLASEYPLKTGWGHSTMEYAVDAAHQAGAKRLALYHHDPTRDDDAVDALVDAARTRAASAGYDGEVFAAVEGEHVVLGRAGPHQPRGGSASAKDIPAIQSVERSVLVAVDDPAIAAVARQAADQEHLAVWDGDSAPAIDLARAHGPAIIILEDNDDVRRQVQALRDLDGPYGEQVTILVITRAARPDVPDEHRVEWLYWPVGPSLLRAKMHAALLRRACRWRNAPLPDDEAERLASLHALGVLDTEPEPRFDRLAREACDRLDVPIALVSLIDSERQWFKACSGLDLTETPRDMAFCAHAIHADDVLQVPDALQDARFADNPAVTNDPRVRFYAGAPLALGDGSKVGTLCVIDTRPRVLDDAALSTLRDLAGEVVAELEASRSTDASVE